MWVVLFLLLLAGFLIYWLLVLSEGVYLGRRAVIALYDRGATSYDTIKQVQPQDDAIYLARPLLSSLSEIEAPLVLDVATGTARLPLSLMRQLDFRGRVVGLDLSGRMLAIAQHKTRSHGKRVGLIHQDAMALPFADASFDAVTCIEALEFLPRPLVALAEMTRVLRPGGQLLISNRVGTDALFFPGRTFRSPALYSQLQALGLIDTDTRRWQEHYDLIYATKPTDHHEMPHPRP
jgi:ubiquinone/menaquinone biosynthesis C-methylase UbiE